MGVTGLLECPPDHTCHTDGGEWPPILLQLGRVFKPFGKRERVIRGRLIAQQTFVEWSASGIV